MSLSYRFDGNFIIFNYNGVEQTSLMTRQVFKEIHDDLENMINMSIYDEVIKYVDNELYLAAFKLENHYAAELKSLLTKDEEAVVRQLVDVLEKEIKKITIREISEKVKLPKDMLVHLASLEEKELILTHHTIGQYIRNEYKLWNLEVIDGGGFIMHPDEVSSVIIRNIWNTL